MNRNRILAVFKLKQSQASSFPLFKLYQLYHDRFPYMFPYTLVVYWGLGGFYLQAKIYQAQIKYLNIFFTAYRPLYDAFSDSQKFVCVPDLNLNVLFF